MRLLMICGRAAALLLTLAAVAGPAPAAEPVPPVAAQADQPRAKAPPQVAPRGGASDRQSLPNPLVQQALRNPQLQLQMMDDPRMQDMMQEQQMQRLIQDPRLQQQMQRDQQLRELYRLQRRPLPGVESDDDD